MGSCKKEIDGYKQREFALEKFNKDDNSAIRFYTSFPNYKALPAFHNCFELKVAKLTTILGSKNVPDSKPYQEEGKKSQTASGN